MTFQAVLVAIRDSVSNLPSSDNVADWEDEDDQAIEQGKLSEDDELGWVIGTITQTAQQCMDTFWQKQMMHNKLIQLRWEDAINYFHEWDKKFGTTELKVLAVVQLQMDDEAPASPTTIFGMLMEYLNIVPGQLQMPQGTSRPGGSHIRLHWVKPQSNTSVASCKPAMVPDSSHLLKAKPVQPLSFTPAYSLQLITIQKSISD
jgi:hypothetical protein